MKPRLLSSKKWTPFPVEYVDHIRQVTRDAFTLETAQGQLLVEGRIYPQELLIRVGFLEEGRLRQANFEASIEYKVERDNVMQMVSLGLDALGAMMETYFESQQAGDEVDFPETWKPFEFLKHTIYMQFSTVNTELEAAADRLLGIDHGSSLMLGDEGLDEPTNPDDPQVH